MRGRLLPRFASLALAAMMIALPLSARADFESDKKICFGPASPDTGIMACSRLIASGKLRSRNLVKAYISRASIYLTAKRDNNRAIRDLDKAISHSPNNFYAYHVRGLAYWGLGDFRRAYSDFDKAIRLNPNFARSYVFRGICLIRLGQADRALRDFDAAIRLNPNDYRPYFDKGVVYYQRGQYQRAIRQFDEVVRLNPRNPRGFGFRGLAKNGLRRYKSAIDDFAQAIRLNPSDQIAHLNRGWAYEQLGRGQEAVRDYRKALRLDPRLSKAREGLRRLGARPIQQRRLRQQPNEEEDRPNGGSTGRGPRQTQPLCKDVGGYEAYMKRTGKVCRLD